MKRRHVVRLEGVALKTQRWINFQGRYDFVDRSNGSDRLAVVLAGYKAYLWPLTLARLERFAPPDIDVCVASPGVHRRDLSELCERRGWSYLATKANYPSLAQNLAIREHPAARFIFKIDEDIFIGEGFFERLLAAYQRVEAEATYRVGFLSPLLNVNGYSYVSFLDALEAGDEYRSRFGPLTHAAGGIPATEDGAAARWLWEKSLAFDDTAALFAAQPPRYSVVPHKFSIGAILFERQFWDYIRGLRVRPFVGGVGVDEQYLCIACMTFSRAMIVAHDVFAGHFSFGPQEVVMRRALGALEPGLLLPDAAPVTTS